MLLPLGPSLPQDLPFRVGEVLTVIEPSEVGLYTCSYRYIAGKAVYVISAVVTFIITMYVSMSVIFPFFPLPPSPIPLPAFLIAAVLVQSQERSGTGGARAKKLP